MNRLQFETITTALRVDVWAMLAFGVDALGIFAMTRQPIATRRIWRFALVIAVALTPLLIPGNQRPVRLAATILAVVFAVKAWDLAVDPTALQMPLARFIIHLLNVFSLVRPVVLAERKPSPTADWTRIGLNAIGGAIAIALAVKIFLIHWASYPVPLEYCCKTFAIFFAIMFVPNAIAAFYRRLGLDATDFCRPYVLARTSAEFWRFYNRPTEQFFRVYVFNPAGGIRHMVRGISATFLVSALIHEYVFDVAAGRVLGTQFLYFSIQGLAVLATARFRPRGWKRGAATLLTLLFNVLTGTVFVSSLNAVFRIWSRR